MDQARQLPPPAASVRAGLAAALNGTRGAAAVLDDEARVNRCPGRAA